MSLPSQVRVGYKKYAILPIPDDWDELQGQHDAQTSTIRVRPSKNPAEAANTLLHEIMHACWSMASLPSKCREERAVDAMANGICQVIVDNPGVFDWIKDQLMAQSTCVN